MDYRKVFFQRAAYQRLCKRHDYHPEFRIRSNHERWRLNTTRVHPNMELDVLTSTPAWQARRTLHNLHLLGSLTTPRVWAAVFGTVWNRWVTARRTDQRHSKVNVCVFGCSNTADDSIEHYSRCAYTRELAARYLHLDMATQANLHSFMLCNPFMTTREELVTSAILVYAIYRGTNHYRRKL